MDLPFIDAFFLPGHPCSFRTGLRLRGPAVEGW